MRRSSSVSKKILVTNKIYIAELSNLLPISTLSKIWEFIDAALQPSIFKYNKEKCNAATIKFPNLLGTIQLFPKSKLTILGVKNYKQAVLLIQHFKKTIKAAGFKKIKCKNLKCVNTCFYKKLPYKINIDKLVMNTKIFSYEPELLCAIPKYFIPNSKACISVCINGVLYGVGFKAHTKYAQHFKKIEKIASKFKLK